MKLASPQAVGIDLGTTFTVVAHLDSSGRPITVSNAEGDLTTPSVVMFDENAIVVGKEAVKAATLEPSRIAQFAKREMGQSVYSKPINGEFYPPEVIQSLILEKVARDAASRIGSFTDVVITVPAYFTEPRRKATQDAGRLAGLNVIDIINEPTAAAIAYGMQQGFLDDKGLSKTLERVLVYDLGGGTFDATIMEIDGKKYKVLATDGDVMLGGADWDQRLVDLIAEAFVAEHGIDPRQDPKGHQRLLRDSEDAKRALTARANITIHSEHASKGVRVVVGRDQFEDMTADLLDRTRFTIAELLKHAKLSREQITRVLLVGGSTRMPMVARMLENEFGKPVDRSLSADEAVAHGAAIYAGLLQNDGGTIENSDVQITNVNSHTLGVLGVEPSTGRPRTKILIEKNTPLPTTQSARFKTRKNNQTSVSVNIVEGGDASGNHATPIGHCVIRDLPPDLPAGTPVEVVFCYAANGRLTVHARMPSIDREARLDIERATGLTDANLESWQGKLQKDRRTLELDA